MTPAPLTVVVGNQSKVYGHANPTLTGTVTGSLNDDDVTAGYSTAASLYSDVVAGGYSITPSGLSGAKAGDYSLSVAGASVANGTLTVLPAPLGIAVNSQSRTYGQLNPQLTGNVAGIYNGDDVTPVYASTATTSSHVVAGGYPITVTGLSGSKAGDYTIVNTVPWTLTVTPAPLTIAATNTGKVYGQANPTFTASYSGFVLGQNPSVLSGTLGFSTQANTASHFGIYVIIPGGQTSSDYAIQYAVAGIAVTPASLVVTAPSLIKIYGQAVPTLTPSYSGFVNGDTPASLTTPVGFSTPLSPASHVGFYPIVAGGATSSDYLIAFDYGIADVLPAILTRRFRAAGSPCPASLCRTSR